MITKPRPPRIHLPKGWQGCVKSAVLHAIALAHCAIVYARAWAADSIKTIENSEPRHGQGQDCRDAMPGKIASGSHDGGTDIERRAAV